MWIIQLADLHFSTRIATTHYEKIIDEMCKVINSNIQTNEDVAVIICGDITEKGKSEGYSEAKKYLNRLKSNIKCANFELVACPGNHDIDLLSKNKFDLFDKFYFDFTHNSDNRFSDKSVIKKIFGNIGFAIINTAFHESPEYGEVNIRALDDILQSINSDLKIIVLHHHLIPIDTRDKSTTVNAFELLKLSEKHGVSLIMHGHQHVEMNIEIGTKKCTIKGIGSLFADVGTNYNNEFNLINIDNSNITKCCCYKFFKEDVSNGYLGTFRCVNN